MTQPTVQGRKLPRNDWEGDDFTPGAGGQYVTCQDTASGRMLAYATNGRIDLDGKVIRAAILPKDSNGVSLEQVAGAIRRLTKPDRNLERHNMTLGAQRTWLRNFRGLVVDGYYGAIPRAFRYQAGADFFHAVFISHYSPTVLYGKGGYRVWDPLNPDTTGYGRWYPRDAIEPFMQSLEGLVGVIALEPTGGTK